MEQDLGVHGSVDPFRYCQEQNVVAANRHVWWENPQPLCSQVKRPQGLKISLYITWLQFQFLAKQLRESLWQVTWCTVGKLITIIILRGWLCESAGWNNIGTVQTRLFASQIYLDYISTSATLTPILREQWACQMKQNLAGNERGFENRRLIWLVSCHSFIVSFIVCFIAQNTFHCTRHFTMFNTFRYWKRH